MTGEAPAIDTIPCVARHQPVLQHKHVVDIHIYRVVGLIDSFAPMRYIYLRADHPVYSVVIESG